MAIEFDPDTSRAADSVSGMSVVHLRDDYPMECGEFYRLNWRGESYDFRVSWDNGFSDVEKMHPTASIAEQSRLMHELNTKKFIISAIDGCNQSILLSNIDSFLGLFSIVCRHRHQTINVVVNFVFWDAHQIKHYKQLVFKPLRDL